MDKLENLLVESAIILDYPAKDAEDIISELGRLLQEAGYVKGGFIAAALEREKTMPTGLPLMGNVNAAIPHTDIVHVLRPGVAFATLAEPVSFYNMAMPDEVVLVSIVFLLALDEPNAQICMLKEIAGILQKPILIDWLIKAHTFDEVRSIIKNRLD